MWATLAGFIAATLGVTLDTAALILAGLASLGMFALIFTPKGQIFLKWFLTNTVGGALEATGPLVEGLSGTLTNIIGAFTTAGNAHGGKMMEQLREPMEAFAKKGFDTVTGNLASAAPVTPDNWKELASKAMGDAFGFGLASFGVTAAFEAVFPERLNTLNGLGPMLATLAGFEEVTLAGLRPVLKAAITEAADQDAKRKFRSTNPAEVPVAIMYSRGLISREVAFEYMTLHGYPDEDINRLLDAAFRPLSPFILRGALATGALSDAELRPIMSYMGLRPGDQEAMIKVGRALALMPSQTQYVAEAQQAFAKGVVGDDEFREVLADSGYTGERAVLATWRALMMRRVTFATEVEAQVVGLVAAGLMTPDEGLSQLEASGVQEWQARTKITLATTKAQLTAARIEAAAERRAALQEQRNLTRVAVDQYKVGTIDEAGLTAALIGIGLSASLVASTVSMASAERAGRMTFAFGLVLPRDDAEVLRQQVNAVEAQMKKQLITIDAARASLAALKLPADEIDALISRWAAGIARPTTTGILTPT